MISMLVTFKVVHHNHNSWFFTKAVRSSQTHLWNTLWDYNACPSICLRSFFECTYFSQFFESEHTLCKSCFGLLCMELGKSFKLCQLCLFQTFFSPLTSSPSPRFLILILSSSPSHPYLYIQYSTLMLYPPKSDAHMKLKPPESSRWKCWLFTKSNTEFHLALNQQRNLINIQDHFLMDI